MLRDRTHRSVEIELDFYREFIDLDKESKYCPPSLETIAGTWIVLSDRTQINEGSIGELRQSIRNIYSVAFNESTKRLTMTATVKGPEQPVVTLAKWDVRGNSPGHVPLPSYPAVLIVDVRHIIRVWGTVRDEQAKGWVGLVPKLNGESACLAMARATLSVAFGSDQDISISRAPA